jgi:hypothetical protein
MYSPLFSTIVFTLEVVLAICFWGYMGTQKVTSYSFMLAFVIVFVFILFFFILDFYLAFNKKLTVMPIIMSVFPPIAIIGLAIYFFYFLVAYSTRIISEKVVNSFYLYAFGQLMLMSIVAYAVYSFTKGKGLYIDINTGSVKTSISMMFVTIAFFMFILNNLIDTALTLYRADG